MYLYELLKIMMKKKKVESTMSLEILKVIQKIFKHYGHDILAEITKILYANKDKSQIMNEEKKRAYSHYNEVSNSYFKKLNDVNNSLQINEISDYYEINDISIASFKNFYDACLDSSYDLTEILINVNQKFIDTSILTKICEMIDSTMNYNRKLVRLQKKNYLNTYRYILSIIILLKNQESY